MPQAIPPNGLVPHHTVLVVVDLQAKLLPAVVGPERLTACARLLLRCAATLGLPVLLTTQYARGLGPTVPEILELAGADEPIDKTSFGCFGSEPFLAALARRAPGRQSLLVAGIETHICVMQTVLGALDAGFSVHVAKDATSSRSPIDSDVGWNRMERGGAVISSTEMAVYELLGASDTEAFKALLPYLREPNKA